MSSSDTTSSESNSSGFEEPMFTVEELESEQSLLNIGHTLDQILLFDNLAGITNYNSRANYRTCNICCLTILRETYDHHYALRHEKLIENFSSIEKLDIHTITKRVRAPTTKKTTKSSKKCKKSRKKAKSKRKVPIKKKVQIKVDVIKSIPTETAVKDQIPSIIPSEFIPKITIKKSLLKNSTKGSNFKPIEQIEIKEVIESEFIESDINKEKLTENNANLTFESINTISSSDEEVEFNPVKSSPLSETVSLETQVLQSSDTELEKNMKSFLEPNHDIESFLDEFLVFSEISTEDALFNRDLQVWQPPINSNVTEPQPEVVLNNSQPVRQTLQHPPPASSTQYQPLPPRLYSTQRGYLRPAFNQVNIPQYTNQNYRYIYPQYQNSSNYQYKPAPQNIMYQNGHIGFHNVNRNVLEYHNQIQYTQIFNPNNGTYQNQKYFVQQNAINPQNVHYLQNNNIMINNYQNNSAMVNQNQMLYNPNNYTQLNHIQQVPLNNVGQINTNYVRRNVPMTSIVRLQRKNNTTHAPNMIRHVSNRKNQNNMFE
ncbi:hypothetical protein A3Q56_05912 [Intoshia linei]|uniref:Uncharacterized protein n=1 Tax=Intoshia linei TaxID=1819745 RepID=A0A177AWH5_9BILA|nr:hypothetical protein A3Q56_05912 [Intoshia linei]